MGVCIKWVSIECGSTALYSLYLIKSFTIIAVLFTFTLLEEQFYKYKSQFLKNGNIKKVFRKC